MFKTNETWEGDEAFINKRPLSTANFDLGGSYAFVNKKRVSLKLEIAGTYRTGRQLWPELSVTTNGHREDFYTFEKLNEIGYAFGLDFSLKVSQRVWITLNASSHNYNFFGEYVGVGLGSTINL